MLDVLYIAWNRLEFTRFTFECLLENTNWDLVDRLIVCDDFSTDGTREYLYGAIDEAPVPGLFFGDEHLGTSVQHLRRYVDWDRAADLFAVVENDLALPPGWLDALADVMERNPELDLLGTECSWSTPPTPDWDGVYNWDPHGHIGGNGLMRLSAFRQRPPFPVLDLTGFEIWQYETKPTLGWITPDLAVCLLDRHPHYPWRALSRQYEHLGWQRPWAKLSRDMTFYWDWFPEERIPVRIAV